MKLRYPCKEHGRYEVHYVAGTATTTSYGEACPGGEFLADDALIIEKVDGEWPEPVLDALWKVDGALTWRGSTSRHERMRWLLDGFSDLLTVREGAG